MKWRQEPELRDTETVPHKESIEADIKILGKEIVKLFGEVTR